jgi:hypothetical protein
MNLRMLLHELAVIAVEIGEDSSAFEDKYHEIESALQEATRWIPVGERLPALNGAYPISDGDIIEDGYFDATSGDWGLIQGRPKVHAIYANDDGNFEVKYWWNVNNLSLPVPPEGGTK